MSSDHIEEYNKKAIEESERALKIYNDTKHALETEERFVNYFKSYNPQSVKSFIEHYATMKAHWYLHAESFANYRRSMDNPYRALALEGLKDIFRKKLFNLKCKWIGGEMDLEGIEVSGDFMHWYYDPSLCGVVQQITEAEFTCYLDFLDDKKNNPADYRDEDDMDTGSSDLAFNYYHQARANYTDEMSVAEYIPDWFFFYDRHFGTGEVLNLPNTRAEVELDYHDIWMEHIYPKTLTEEQLKNWSHLNRAQCIELRLNKEKRDAYFAEQNRKYEERKKTEPQYEHMSIYDHKKMKVLVAMIETPEVQKFYAANREWLNRRSKNDMIEGDIIALSKAEEWIPIRANDDYRDGVKEAHDDYENKKIREVLPVVFEEYRECVDRKKKFEWNLNAEEKKYKYESDLKARLLAARKWKGEPENFDFLKKENLPKTN